MAAITDQALQGEWFYLEEEQPFDRTSPSFYILGDGRVTPNDRPEDIGSYVIRDGRAVVQFPKYARAALTIELLCDEVKFDESTDVLTANASYEMAAVDEPLHYYGTFVRRRADYLAPPLNMAPVLNKGELATPS
ncbi:hypothetical protein [Sphingomonas faeni]|uniref:hypothetical protein n=1 Tax=Sphingomonas faeni TaxID=185950 RepID=UPI0027833E20|nr:hypothetical protein [Sphingomonas faeni]MDQ0839863.1 hypothetical protein [Sphingomonas faeni]